jgi:DNA invertase Pin-like site-specific DNA recombinase
MKIGYARTSTEDQNLNLQHDALTKFGCEKIFSDQQSGTIQDRKGLQDAITFARANDSIVVWRLDRLGRSLGHLIQTVNAISDRGIAFISLQEAIDTTTANGRLTFHLFSALSEFEASLLRERTKAGLAAARARGRIGGRPSKLTTAQVEMARTLLVDSKGEVKEVCKMLGVSRSTVYRYLNAANESQKRV